MGISKIFGDKFFGKSRRDGFNSLADHLLCSAKHVSENFLFKVVAEEHEKHCESISHGSGGTISHAPFDKMFCQLIKHLLLHPSKKFVFMLFYPIHADIKSIWRRRF